VDVTFKNNTNQSLSAYYYVGSNEKVVDIPPGQSVQLTGITAVSPSTDRLLKSKYLSIVYSTASTQESTLPLNVRGMAWAGHWNGQVSYHPGYVVSFSGSVWVAKNGSKNSEPDLLNTDWELIGAQELNSLLNIEISSIPVGSVIYRDEYGWTFGQLSDSSISGSISMGKINGLSEELDDKLAKTGPDQTIEGNVSYTGDITGVNHLVNKAYADTKLALAGGTMTGAILMDPSVPVVNQQQLTTKEYVDAVSSGYLPLAGGEMTGFLSIPLTPVSDNHAANKAYVDTKLSLSGGVVTGFLTLSQTPTSSLHAANKAYVDSQALAGGVLTGKLKLPIATTIDDQADLTNKKYVDSQALAGGILTGKLKLPVSTQVSDNDDLTNKLYVDSVMMDRLARSGGTMTGLIYYNVPRVGVSADPVTDIFTFQSHGFKSGRSVIPTFTSGFGGITSGSTYYIVSVPGDQVKNQFKLAYTFGNSTVGEAGSTTLYTGSTASLAVGQPIDGVGFQTNTIISRIDGPTSFIISNTLLLSQPRPIDVTSEGVGATFKYATQELDDQVTTKDYIDDVLGISGETLTTSGGTMIGPILGNHGLLQTDGNKSMTGSLILADLPDITMDGLVPREWAILGFAFHSATESKVYIDDILAWASHHDIKISGTGLYDGVYEVSLVDKENGYLVIEREFDGTVSGTANQYAGGLYFSTTENGVSYRRRKLISRGSSVVVEGNILDVATTIYEVQPSDGVLLVNSTPISIIDLGDPNDAIGQVVIKKVNDSTGSFVIVKGINGGDSNLVLDTKYDAVVMESIKDGNGGSEWTPIARIRNGENVARVIFNGCFLRFPGSLDVDISTQRSFEKTTKVTSVTSVTIASVACIEMTVEDASDFQTAVVITVEGSVSGYNGNYAENNIISVDTVNNKITLTNINDVSIVNESNFFLVSNVNKLFKSNLALTTSPVVNDIRQSRLSARIAGFANAGDVLSDPSSSSESSSRYTDVILGNNISIESIENVPVVIDGVTTIGTTSPYSLYRPGHGLVNGDQVVFVFDGASSSSSSSSEAEQFGGLVSGETYYVTNVVDELDDEFDLSDERDGAAIPITSPGVNGVLTKVDSSGVLKVILNREEFDGAFTSGELTSGDKININWASTGSGSYDGSYLVDDVDVGDVDTLPSVTIRGAYVGVITSGYPKMAEAVDASDWIPGFHLVQISNYSEYTGIYDLVAVDPVYGKLTIRKDYVSPAAPVVTPGVDVVSRSTHIIKQHPSVFGKVLNGENTDVVSARTDGDGDLTIRLLNPVTDINLPSNDLASVANISNEISGSYLHAVSGGIFDLTGEITARVTSTLVYSSTIVSGGGPADGNGHITFAMNNVIGFREGDSVRISTELVDRTVISIDNNNITIDGGDYTLAGAQSITNSSVMVLVLDDMSSGAFDVGDPIIIRDVTSLGSSLIKTTVSGTSPLITTPYTAPRIVIRGFNKAVDDPNGEPVSAQTSVAEDSLIFESLHNFSTGQKVRVAFANTIYTGFSLTADLYAIRLSVSSIRLAISQINAFDGRFINLIASGSGTVTPLATVSTAFDPTGSLIGTVEVPKILSLYSIKPWSWMSWRSTFTLVSGNLETWTDYSGNGRNFAQGTIANRPVYVGSNFNGVAAIRYFDFTSNNKFVSYSLPQDKPQSLTIIFVAKMSGNGVVFKSGTSITFSRDSLSYSLSGVSGSLITGGRPGSAAGVYTIVLDGDNSRFRKFTSFASSPQEVFGSIIGGLTSNISIGSGSGGFNGGLTTFMVFSSALNDDQISFLERSLAYEHGITTLSNNAFLNTLSIVGSDAAGIIFSPAFNGYTTTGYSVSIQNSVTWARVTATPIQSNASMRVRINSGGWSTLISGIQSGNLNLNAGSNIIEIEVVAQDDTTDEIYELSIFRRAAPTVNSPTFTSVGVSSAIVGGTVVTDNGAAIYERGIVYSALADNADPIIGGTSVTQSVATGTVGTFTKSISGLSPGTAYNFKAYAINAEGTTYSNVLTFSTLSNNALLSALSALSGSPPSSLSLTPSFSSIQTSYTATVTQGNKTMTVTPTVAQVNATVKVRINSGSYATVTSGSQSGSLSLVNLNSNPNIVDVEVTAQDGVTTENYSISVTRPATTPTVTTPTQASVTDTTATLGGNVTSDGGDDITERGVVYSETGTNSNPIIGGTGVTKEPGTGTTGIFTVNVGLIVGLTSATGYSYKAYATNSQGTTYTSVDTFTTL